MSKVLEYLRKKSHSTFETKLSLVLITEQSGFGVAQNEGTYSDSYQGDV